MTSSKTRKEPYLSNEKTFVTGKAGESSFTRVGEHFEENGRRYFIVTDRYLAGVVRVQEVSKFFDKFSNVKGFLDKKLLDRFHERNAIIIEQGVIEAAKFTPEAISLLKQKGLIGMEIESVPKSIDDDNDDIIKIYATTVRRVA